jgi:hypothetical protein
MGGSRGHCFYEVSFGALPEVAQHRFRVEKRGSGLRGWVLVSREVSVETKISEQQHQREVLHREVVFRSKDHGRIVGKVEQAVQ